MDTIVLCNQKGEKLDQKKFIKQIEVLMVHSTMPIVRQKTKLSLVKIENEDEIAIRWKPFIKGYYSIYINQTLINTRSQIIVVSQLIDFK